MIKFFLYVFIASQVLAIPTSNQGGKLSKCRKNEVLVDCVEPCQPSCSWPNRPKCPTFACSKGYECQRGYLRATNESTSPCIKCDTASTCGKNEELSSCANPCQPSCSWKNRPACPTFTCSSGCVCQKNFYRASNGTNSPCIQC